MKKNEVAPEKKGAEVIPREKDSSSLALGSIETPAANCTKAQGRLKRANSLIGNLFLKKSTTKRKGSC
jgi:hypothetical protein